MPRVQLSAPSERQRGVGGVAQQHVPELEVLALGARGAQEAVVDRVRDRLVDGLVDEVAEGCDRERASDHRCGADHVAVRLGQARKPGREERVERRRRRGAALAERQGELLEEERVAVGGEHELGERLRLDRRAVEQTGDELLARRRVERRQLERVSPAPRSRDVVTTSSGA